MKRILYLLLFFVLPETCVFAQTPSKGYNFIIETVVRDSGVTMLSQLDGIPIFKANRNVQYFDGLGRPLQTVQWQGSPQKKDVVQHIEYDGFGRESRKYLPYVSTEANASYKTLGNNGVHAFYNNAGITDIVRTPHPYAEAAFELSTLDRVKEQGAAGSAWQPYSTAIVNSGHTVKTDHGTNTTEYVSYWLHTSVGADGTSKYLPGKLKRTTIADENWTTGKSGIVKEYRDFEDKVVLRRIWSSETDSLDTYYVYDDFGDLRYIIPPGYTANTLDTSTVSFNEFVFAYRYDVHRRLIEKKLPGKGWEYIVYNRNDQPVLTQDAVQRSKPVQEWNYSKYDAFGRVTESGVYSHSYGSRAALQAALDNHWDSYAAYWEERVDSVYSNVTFPTSSLKPLIVNFYDDYSFEDRFKLGYVGIYPSDKTKTLVTGSRIYKDDGSAPLLTVNYYDDLTRLIQSASQNHLGGTDYVTNTYSFIGELLSSKREHKPSPSGSTTTILTTNTYDHVGRLLNIKHKIDDQDEVILLSNEYNELGQLRKKSVGGKAQQPDFLDSTVYSYNERGWTLSATSPHFSYSLSYDNPVQGALAQYNGNISEQHWTHKDQAARHFGYSYDKLNRLTDGNSTNGNMREQLEYDLMGNITKLTRDNHPTGTTYSYTGNRLKSLTGAISTATDYTYDVNGNATKDRTGMNFNYNHLNLPDSVWNGTVSVGYLYDAMGTKLRKYSNQGGNRDYVGGIEYGSSGIELIHTGMGVAVNNGGTFKYRYNLNDHLGNVRATLQRDSSTGDVEILQQDDYYPFGMQYQQFVSGAENKYLYNGKEKQDELGGGNQYDYGARFYDTEIGRWNVVDPLAEKYIGWSPYNYAVNNPILFIDPDGRGVTVYINGMPASNFDAQMFFAALKLNTSSWINNDSKDQEDPKGKKKDGGFWVGVQKGAKDLVSSMAPIRPAEEGDPTSIAEYFENLKNMPEAVYDVLSDGNVEDRTRMAIGFIGLLRGKSKGKFTNAITNGGSGAQWLEGLMNAGSVADKGGFTAVGRALQKHGSRAGSIFPQAIGNAAAINAQGQAVLNGILTHPNVVSGARHHARFGNVMEYRVPGGQGARFSGDGKTFIGFLE